MKASVIALAALVLVAALFVFAAQRTVPPWPERLPHVRLEPARPILRDADVTTNNAYFYIRELTNATAASTSNWDSAEFSEFAACGWEKGKYPSLEDWADASAPGYDLLRRAAALTNSHVATADSITALMPHISPLMRLAKGGGFLIEEAAAKGDWKTVEDYVWTILVAADQSSRGGVLIEALVDYACTASVCQSLRRVALRGKVPGDVAGRLGALLDDIDRNMEPFAEIVRYEHLMFRNVMTLLYKDPIAAASLSGEEVDRVRQSVTMVLKWPVLAVSGSLPERTAKHVDAAYSHLIEQASAPRPTGKSLMDAVPRFAPKGVLQWTGVATDDGIGRVLVSLLVPALDNAMNRSFGHRATLRGTRIVLALRAYEAAEGRVPESLLDLVPKYLESVPEDSFSRTGEPFRFGRTNDAWVVYSVGPDGKDDGGKYDWQMPVDKERHSGELDVCFFSDETARRCEQYRLKNTAPTPPR